MNHTHTLYIEVAPTGSGVSPVLVCGACGGRWTLAEVGKQLDCAKTIINEHIGVGGLVSIEFDISNWVESKMKLGWELVPSPKLTILRDLDGLLWRVVRLDMGEDGVWAFGEKVLGNLEVTV